MELFDQVVCACKALEDKKANDITIIDVSKTSSLTTYIVIATATSNTQAKALLDNVNEKLEQEGILALHKEGYGQSDWVVLDYGDFIVHVFTQEVREYYNLEKLYQDGKNLRKFESVLKDLIAKQKREEKQKQKQTKKETSQVEKQEKTVKKTAAKQTKKTEKQTKKAQKVEKKETKKATKTASKPAAKKSTTTK